MKTHNKITILLICVVTAMSLILMGYEYIRSQEIQFYMNSKKISDETIIKKVLKFKSESFSKPTQDNAAWDGIVEFTKKSDTAWAKENIEPIIITCDMSFLGVFDTKGKRIYSVSDSNSLRFNINSALILDWFKNNKIIHDFLVLDGVLYEIFGAKIVPSYDVYYNSPAQGYLISAKQWNKVHLKDIEEATDFKLELLKSKPKNTETEQNEIIIYIPLKDNQGNNLDYLKFHKTYQNFDKFQSLRFIAILGFTLMLIIFGIFVYFTSKWIAKPLKQITSYLSDEKVDYIHDLLKGKGSFSEIAKLLTLYTEQRNAYLNEIIERKLAEKAIIKQKMLFEQLFKNAPIGIIMLDENECVLEINPEFTKIFNFRIEDIHGKDLNNFLVPRHLVDESHRLSKQTIIGENAAQETVRRRKDGSLVAVSVYGMPIVVDSEIIGIYGMYIDITERQKAALQLETYSQKLKELNITKDKFFSIIAHDLKSPFNSITGFSELLLENYSSMEIDEIRTSLKFIQSSSKHAYTLLENLLVWARSQTQAIEFIPVVFNLKDGIYDTLLMAQSISVKKRIELIFEIDDSISILADINMINTIIRNLLSNAIKFTPQKGKVSITINQNSDSWLFTISDTGVGIDAKNIDKLFKIESKFSTFGTENETGTGLGLILCKEFVEKHGGNIEVKSSVNQGTEFTFSIPKS
ncbi:MAG: ATP-binding protein [bacterium]